MAMAFVLINAETGSEQEVLDEIRKIDAVKESLHGLRCLRYSS